MLKMMNPLGSVPSMPTPGNKEDTELSREERLQQERDKKEEMVRAEKERKQRYFVKIFFCIVPMILIRYLWEIFFFSPPDIAGVYVQVPAGAGGAGR